MAEQTLYYHDGQQMHLGDRVRIRRFLRSPIVATIDYLSGESTPHCEIEIEGLVAFAISRRSDTCVIWMRLPGERLTKRFELLARGTPEKAIAPTDDIS